jgi:ferredoxin-NADP reductase
MSLLRTAADRADPRAFVLFYANRRLEDVTFAEELEHLRQRLDLRIVHVLSQPPEPWTGEQGRITADLLQRHAPDDLSRWDFFLCGAAAPVDAGITALSEIGIPPEHVHAERFVEV